MADITMCDGKECPIKDRCYRHTATKSNWQSFFTHTPYNKELGICGDFWDNNLSESVKKSKKKESKK
jgi:hypothetical protein